MRAKVRRLFGFVAVVLGAAALLLAHHHSAGAESSGLSSHDLAVYKQAFAQVKKDRWKEARRIAETGKDPLPAKVIQWPAQPPIRTGMIRYR